MPRSADWFSSLTKKAQKEYIAKHPNSKYAKGAKSAAKTPAKTRIKATPAVQAAELKTKVANFRAAEKAKLARSRKSPAVQAAELKTKVANFRAAEKAKAVKSKATSGASKVTSLSLTGKTKKPVSAKAVKTAHDKKRVTDKNKVVAKTPSAKRGVKTISGKTPAETKLKQRIAGLRLSLQMQNTTTASYKRRKAQYDKLRADLKAMK